MDAVFGILGKGPPHGNAVLDQRAVVCFAQFKSHVIPPSHFDGFHVDFDVPPAVALQVFAVFDGFSVEVDVIVHKHRNAPRMVARVANRGKRQATDVVAIVFNLGRHNVRFVPHRWLRVGHVGIVAKQHFAARRLVSADDPSVGSQPLRNGAKGIQTVRFCGDCRNVRRCGTLGFGPDLLSAWSFGTVCSSAGDGDAGKSLWAGGQVGHVCWPQGFIHPVEDGLCLEVNGKTVCHKSCSAVNIVGVEGLGVGAQ